jgi:hypothetical protein
MLTKNKNNIETKYILSKQPKVKNNMKTGFKYYHKTSLEGNKSFKK